MGNIKTYIVKQIAWVHPNNPNKTLRSGELVKLEDKDARQPLDEDRIVLQEKAKESVLDKISEGIKPKKKGK